MEYANNKPMYLEAKIELHEETALLREKASAIIDLPKENERQPDLQYFTAIFVSSGENLNGAYFTTPELVKAEATIVNKALDIEHEETEIIGHIYDRAFMTKDGEKLSLEELKAETASSMEKKEIHVAIAGIIYKTRFSDIAEEVASGDWKVSMETFYRDFDIKIGELVLSRKEAESLGFDSSNASLIGKFAKVIKGGVELANGKITRVLRDLVFSGCGIVKNPANPPSIILETANVNKETIVLDYDKINKDNVTSATVDESNKEVSEITHDDTLGICVNYKKQIIDSTFKDQDSKVIHENWCSRYDLSCSSFSRDTSDPECLLHKDIVKQATACVSEIVAAKDYYNKRKDSIINLNKLIEKANSVLNTK